MAEVTSTPRTLNFKDITGQRFNRFVVLEPVGRSPYGMVMWRCRCDCGIVKIVRGDKLRASLTTSCGCAQRDAVWIHGCASKGKETGTYKSWNGMLDRCGYPKAKGYKNYGGRGITVCERWLTFENFLADMGPRPAGKYSIERVDVNGNYCPENCIWLPMSEQAKNRRRHSHR